MERRACRCSRRTPGRRSEDTTQNSTFFSDSTTATTSAMPEFIAGYNKGLVGLPRGAQLGRSTSSGTCRASSRWPLHRARSLNGWRLSGIVRMRSGSPLTPMLQTNRSRSLWSPSLGPGTGPDRPSYAPGRGPERRGDRRATRWFDPTAFVLQPVGHLRQRRPQRVASAPTCEPWTWRSAASSAGGRSVSERARSSCGSRSSISSIARTSDRRRSSHSPARPMARRRCASFGQIRTTVTSARQMQVGLRVRF